MNYFEVLHCVMISGDLIQQMILLQGSSTKQNRSFHINIVHFRVSGAFVLLSKCMSEEYNNTTVSGSPNLGKG